MVIVRPPEKAKRNSTERRADDRYLFQARSSNVKELHAVLKAIAFRETGTISLSSSGMRIVVEELKCLQANAFLQHELFDEFIIGEETINFCLNISVLCECLNLFGGTMAGQSSGASVKFLYSGYGAPLKLLLEESGIITDCSIKTMEPTALLDFDFSPANVVSKIIMRPEALRDTFQELDPSTELVEISMDPNDGFRITASDSYCSTVTDIPKDSEIIDSFTCSKPQSFKYRINLLKPTVKALQLANKISQRIDKRGFLSVQYMIDFGGRVTFIEFECAPEYDPNEVSQSTESMSE